MAPYGNLAERRK